MKEASLSYSQAVFLAGSDFARPVIENVGSAQVRVRTKADNVAGVKLPVFETYMDGSAPFEYTGLGRGGQQIQRCKEVRGCCEEVVWVCGRDWLWVVSWCRHFSCPRCSLVWVIVLRLPESVRMS